MNTKPISRFVAGAFAGIVLAGATGAKADLVYTFDTPGSETASNPHGDGADRQGWTDTIGASQPSFTVPGGRTSVPGSPNGQDSQNNNMVFTSPAFYLTGGTITVDLSGGEGNGASPVDPANLPKNISNISPGLSGTDPTNVLVLGLRDVATGNYVSFLQKNQLADAWTTYTWDVSAVPTNAAYVIDQIDTRYGGWGHIELDNVNIPGTAVPEPAMASFALGGLALLLRRRARRA